MRLLHTAFLFTIFAVSNGLSGCAAPHWDEVRSSELTLGGGTPATAQPDTADAATIFAPHDGEVQACLDRATLADPSVRRAVTIEVHFSVTGQASKTEVVGTMPDPVKDCIEKATQGWMWPEVSNHSPLERKTYRQLGE